MARVFEEGYKINICFKNLISETKNLTFNFLSRHQASSSIFTSHDYLTLPLGSCNHCLNIIYPTKESYYVCNQCPIEFKVCTKCINMMQNEHPPQHTFQEGNYFMPGEMKIHFNTQCNGCGIINFGGTGYQCEECRTTYNLCEFCYMNAHNLHPNHTFKILQATLIGMNNRLNLSKRALLKYSENFQINNMIN